MLQVPLYAYALAAKIPGARAVRVEYRALKKPEGGPFARAVQVRQERRGARCGRRRATRSSRPRWTPSPPTSAPPAPASSRCVPAASCGCPPFCHALEICRVPGGPEAGELVMDAAHARPSSPRSSPPTTTSWSPPARAPARPAPSSAASSTCSACRSRGERIAEPLTLRDIAAITYTNAAAADLKRKLREELRKAGRRDEAYEIDAARIGTIHAFCGAILREFALRSGRNPAARVLEEGEASRARRRGDPRDPAHGAGAAQRAGPRRSCSPGTRSSKVKEWTKLLVADAARLGSLRRAARRARSRRPARWWTSR